jgi:hypothetical protein
MIFIKNAISVVCKSNSDLYKRYWSWKSLSKIATIYTSHSVNQNESLAGNATTERHRLSQHHTLQRTEIEVHLQSVTLKGKLPRVNVESFWRAKILFLFVCHSGNNTWQFDLLDVLN